MTYYLHSIKKAEKLLEPEHLEMKKNQNVYMYGNREGIRGERTTQHITSTGERVNPKFEFNPNYILRLLQHKIAKLRISQPKFECTVLYNTLMQYWDGSPSSLLKAVDIYTAASQEGVDPNSLVGNEAFTLAQGILEDANQQQEEKMRNKNLCKTYDILFKYFLKDVNFPDIMERLIYECEVNGVGFLKVELRRTYNDFLSDTSTRPMTISDIISNRKSAPLLTNSLAAKLKVDISLVKATDLILDPKINTIHNFGACDWVAEVYRARADTIANTFNVSRETLALTDEAIITVYKYFSRAESMRVILCSDINGKELFLTDMEYEEVFPFLCLTLNTVVHHNKVFPVSTVRLGLEPQEIIKEIKNYIIKLARDSLPKYVFDNQNLSAASAQKVMGNQPFSLTAVDKYVIDAPINSCIETFAAQYPNLNILGTNKLEEDLENAIGLNMDMTVDIAPSKNTTNLAERQQNVIINSTRSKIDSIVLDAGRILFNQFNNTLNEEEVRTICGAGAVWNPSALSARIVIKNSNEYTNMPFNYFSVISAFGSTIPSVNKEQLFKDGLKMAGVPDAQIPDYFDPLGEVERIQQQEQQLAQNMTPEKNV